MVLRELNEFKSCAGCRILKHENSSQLQPRKHEPTNVTLLINENIFPNNNLFIACSNMYRNNVFTKLHNNPKTQIESHVLARDSQLSVNNTHDGLFRVMTF